MAFRDLRDFLNKLEDEGQLITLGEPVHPDSDIRDIALALADKKVDGPAVFIENIIGFPGEKAVLNIYGSTSNYALMMGKEKDASLKDMFNEMIRRWDKRDDQIKWVKNPPCQEVIIDKDINLYKTIPLSRLNTNDGGSIIPKSLIVTKDPSDIDNFDRQLLEINPIQFINSNTIRLRTSSLNNISDFILKAKSVNKPLPIAICLGLEPMLMSIANLPLENYESKYPLIASINGIPLELTKGITCDLDVPAGSEYIIEGEILPTGIFPFGHIDLCENTDEDVLGVQADLIINVKAVTHRRNPIFDSIYNGLSWTEDKTISNPNSIVYLYMLLKEILPEVKAVNAIYLNGLMVVVAVDNKFRANLNSVAKYLLSTSYGKAYINGIIFVDIDVDPFDMNQVMGALALKISREKGRIIFPNTGGNPSDTIFSSMDNKIIIDTIASVTVEKINMNPGSKDYDNKDNKYRKLIGELHKAALNRHVREMAMDEICSVFDQGC